MPNKLEADDSREDHIHVDVFHQIEEYKNDIKGSHASVSMCRRP